MAVIFGPFSDEQIENLAQFQKSGAMHPFTCRNEHEGDRVLVPHLGGMRCLTCGYSQNWVHDFMTFSIW